MRIIFVLAGAFASIVAIATPGTAQVMVDIPIWSNGILGQQALRNAQDNFNEANGIDDANEKPRSASRECSADALPAEDRRRMEIEYADRVKDDGKASADAWVREQGMRFHQQLVDEGICAGPGRAGPNVR